MFSTKLITEDSDHLNTFQTKSLKNRVSRNQLDSFLKPITEYPYCPKRLYPYQKNFTKAKQQKENNPNRSEPKMSMGNIGATYPYLWQQVMEFITASRLFGASDIFYWSAFKCL
jgi:hypothetical protein